MIEDLCEKFLVNGDGIERIGNFGRRFATASGFCFEGDVDDSCTLFDGICDLSMALVKATGISPDFPSRKVLFLNRDIKSFEAIIYAKGSDLVRLLKEWVRLEGSGRGGGGRGIGSM